MSYSLTSLPEIALKRIFSICDHNLLFVSKEVSRLYKESAQALLIRNGTKIDNNKFVSVLALFKSIENVQINYAISIKEASLIALGGVRTLKHLTITYCDTLSDDMLAHLLPLAHLQTCNFENCSKITASGNNIQILQNRLKEVKIEGFKGYENGH